MQTDIGDRKDVATSDERYLNFPTSICIAILEQPRHSDVLWLCVRQSRIDSQHVTPTISRSSRSSFGRWFSGYVPGSSAQRVLGQGARCPVPVPGKFESRFSGLQESSRVALAVAPDQARTGRELV